MKRRRSQNNQRSSPSRRWHIPPPLIHGPETLEGGGVLQDWGNELGVVLWQAFRDVMLWATTPAENRDSIFSDPPEDVRRIRVEPVLGLYADPRLLSSLETLRQIAEQPAGTREEDVARACRALSEWADDQGKLATALAFAQNAALASGGDAAAAFWVATIAVRLNDHARAEVWFRRAIGLARQSRNWRMYSRAFGGLGNLYIRRGNLPAARRLHTRALRGAKRGGMRREQAAALHDLFAVAVESGSGAEAERLARLALESYGTRNRRVHVLAHDVAYYWMEQGSFDRALPVFQAVLPLIERPIERLFVLADIARAAGGVGDVETASDTATQVWLLASEPDLEHGAGRALLEVARGYLSLSDTKKAAEAAQHALTSAAEYRESKVRFAAEALLESIGSTPAPTPPSLAPSDEVGDQLAADFVRTLQTIAGAAD
ncbi:MAG: tetratricopeptide repeat protein [Gemmatimonadota bacterium]